MKTVLISIHPKWVIKIATQQKSVEVRKTRPKFDIPFRCYIYMTKGHSKIPINVNRYSEEMKFAKFLAFKPGLVIGEFVCDRIDEAPTNIITPETMKMMVNSELSIQELCDYGRNKTVYGWHISDFKLYDKPKKLNEFCMPCKMSMPFCDRCEHYSIWNCRCENITRPPQSWCYVEQAYGDERGGYNDNKRRH